MKVDLFDFELPADLIARHPVEPRDAARLLDLTDAEAADRTVSDLPDLLTPGDILVLNDTRVVPTRIEGQRGEARIEATLHKNEGDGQWAAFARPGKRLKPGDRVTFAGGLNAHVIEKREGGEVLFDFGLDETAMFAALHQHGRMPLPPYIKRALGEGSEDAKDYQTCYAARDGAVAAPTAGLHFTENLFTRLQARGIEHVFLTLHVGAGTFLPIKVDNTDDHAMHAEWGEVTAEVAERLNRARAAGGRIVSVGTTSLRLLESATSADGTVQCFAGETDIFITPGYRFRGVDLLVTNFHLPRSTLLMLVSAFVGRERVLAAYEHAKASGYRFYSYGDCCLLSREIG
jgi:S-adenosylmethionine:tRNA ribosyltransferase-isomerase